MSILTPTDEALNKADRAIELLEEKETLLFDLLNCASANIVITNHNLPQLVKEALDDAKFPLLSSCKGREIVSLDCRGLKKGDAYGWMVALSKKVNETPDLIVVIEHIAEMPSGPQCDDPQYVENLLGHSWKNGVVFFGDNMINTTEMTVLLTATPEFQDEVGVRYGTDSYAWFVDFDKTLDDIWIPEC